jgi:hypothetical protein
MKMVRNTTKSRTDIGVSLSISAALLELPDYKTAQAGCVIYSEVLR